MVKCLWSKIQFSVLFGDFSMEFYGHLPRAIARIYTVYLNQNAIYTVFEEIYKFELQGATFY